MIEAVIFDCDGVLVDSEVLALEVELGSLAEIGLDYSRPEFVARFTGRSNEAFFALLEEDSLARRGCGLPDGFRDFVRLVVPELQRRGLFRKEYTGRSLRENLGLWRPANPHSTPFR